MNNDKSKLFQEYKENISKKYPGAKTMKCNVSGKFYVADSDGLKINPFNTSLEDSETVYDAWRILNEAYKLKWINKHIIKRNTDYFSDNKIKSYAEMMINQQ